MGVGGSGASAAFAIAKRLGYTVSGCDRSGDSPYLDSNLKKLTLVGHDPSHLADVDLLVYSPAVPLLDPENPEFVEAQKKGVETMTWEQFVGEELLKNKFVIAVSGTHGKGTTAAMVSQVLVDAGKDPTCLIGGTVVDWGKNWRVGKSKYFVIEADEYREKFLNYKADIAVIGNIGFDHPEYFESIEKVREAFIKFVRNTKERSILIEGSDVKLENPNGRTAVISQPVRFELKVPGNFNKMNAALSAAVGRELLVNEKRIKRSLEKFKGLKRRFEFVGEEKGVLVFDDYAHHPTAILETAKALREKFPDKKISLVFQPHTFSRTKKLFEDFVECFKKIPVDRIILLDIFTAREKDDKEISSKDFVKAVGGEKVKYIPDVEQAAVYLAKVATAGEVVIYMSAGDWKFPNILLNKLRNKG